MKTSKITLSFAVIALAVAVSVVSCKKKSSTNPAADTDSSSANDNALAERTADDITTMGAQSSETGSTASYRYGDENSLSACASVVTDTTLKTITITFNGQTCLDGHTRSGTITYTYSGGRYYRNPGYKMVVSSNNYTVDGNAVTLSKTVTNTTPNLNPGTNLTWSDVSNITIAKPAGTITWSATKVKTLLNTSDTAVYHGQAVHITWTLAHVGITGNATGTDAAGETFTANITSQLERDFNCSPNSNFVGQHPFINGTLDFTPGTKATRHIDYGYPNNGTCDNLAKVTIGSYTVAITLP
jgi:hypothetical protein